jgi:hypothetical protein
VQQLLIDRNEYRLTYDERRRNGYPKENLTCKQNLVIRIFQRSEGNHLRAFVNLKEVEKLAAIYAVDVKTITLSSNSTFAQAVSEFNSFDILITPHGSHLTNGILMLDRSRKPFIVELVSTCVNSDFKDNLGKEFATYFISTGHELEDTKLREASQGCEGYEHRACRLSNVCSFGAVRSAAEGNISVNLTTLQAVLQSAISTVCEFPQSAVEALAENVP